MKSVIIAVVGIMLAISCGCGYRVVHKNTLNLYRLEGRASALVDCIEIMDNAKLTRIEKDITIKGKRSSVKMKLIPYGKLAEEAMKLTDKKFEKEIEELLYIPIYRLIP